jgi:hypothetical protein
MCVRVCVCVCVCLCIYVYVCVRVYIVDVPLSSKACAITFGRCVILSQSGLVLERTMEKSAGSTAHTARAECSIPATEGVWLYGDDDKGRITT